MPVAGQGMAGLLSTSIHRHYDGTRCTPSPLLWCCKCHPGSLQRTGRAEASDVGKGIDGTTHAHKVHRTRRTEHGTRTGRRGRRARGDGARGFLTNVE